MKKLALIFAAIMLISLASVFCVSADSTAVWDGTAATKFAGGNGSEGNPYQISNAAEWAYFANQINSKAETGKFYKLTANITFNEGDAKTWSTTAPANDMTQYIVGNKCNENPFIGTFDGNGKTVSGFYANTGDEDTVGLFGSTAGGTTATIKNLVVTNSYFKGKGAMGAIVGQTSGGTTNISAIYVDDTVILDSTGKYVGGIAGHNGENGFNTPTINIKSCVNAATITATGSDCVGGMLGNLNNKIATISNCLNIGDVSGKASVGGIVGWSVGSAETCELTVDSCVNVGKISGTKSSGAGAPCAIACINEVGNKTVSDCFYAADSAVYGVFSGKGELSGAATSKTVYELCGSSLVSGLNSSNWVARGSGKTYEICIPKAVSAFAPAETKLHKTDNTPSWLADYDKKTVFEIDTVQKFMDIANYVNNKYPASGDFYGKTIKLTADLTFNEGDASKWGTTAPANDMTDYIIGSWTGTQFRGTFDGQGHTISGFYAKKGAGAGDTVAIIGCTAGGKTATVQNLVITNSYFESKSGAVAACVAQTKGGETTIKNVYVTNSVTIVSGKEFAGGIIAHVGQGEYAVPTLVVDSCVNEATVRADSKNNGDANNIGGILGNGNTKNVYISNCLNTGDISGYRYVGGIIGRADGTKDKSNKIEIKNCINVGIITAAFESATDNLGKACAIACFGNDTNSNLTTEDCFYLFGSGLYGAYKNKTEAEGTNSAKSGSDFIGLNVNNFIFKKFADWTLRDGMIMIPTALATFAPASTYAGGEIETEPAPETDPTPETDKQPETDKPETKKPVETTEPSTSSGGCGGFTTVAAAILVAMAGLSTAIVIKKK